MGDASTDNTGANAQATVLADNVTINNDGGGCTDGIHGSGVSVNGSNETVNEDGSSSVTITGNNDADYAAAGSVVGFNGSGEWVSASNATIYTDTAGTSVSVNGNSDAVGAVAGSVVGFNGWGEWVGASNATIYETTAGTSVSVNGNSDAVGAVAGSVVGFNGWGESVNASNATIYETTAGTSVSVGGNYDVVGAVAGSVVGFNGFGEYVSASGATVYETTAGTSVTVAGNNDTVGDVAGDATGFAGSGEVFYGNNDSVYGDTAETSATVHGSGDSVTLGTYGDNVDFASDDSGDTLYGSGDAIELSDGDGVTIDGSHDTIYGSYDSIAIYGNDDLTIGTRDSIYASGYGDDASGAGDALSGSDYFGGSGGDGGYYGLVAGAISRSTGIDVIAQYDASQGNAAGAKRALTGLGQAEQAVAAAEGIAGAAAPSPFEGAAWDTAQPITWSFADSAGTAASPFSSTIGTSYQSAIVQAFETWANAAGIAVQEVSGSAASDITVGFADFGTQATGVIGYTTIQKAGGALQAGVTIQLEDPNEDAIGYDASGNLVYTASGVQLGQLALHEAGHALGLGESADPNSVMYSELGSANVTLDGTDIADIQALYGTGSGANAQLLQAMASFGATAAPVAATLPPPAAAASATLAVAH